MITRINSVVATVRHIESVLAGLSTADRAGALHESRSGDPCGGGVPPAFPGCQRPVRARAPIPFDLTLRQVEASPPPLVADSAPAGELDAIIREAAARSGLDPALLHAVIKAESNYNPRCVSPAGARGLMQLMPATAGALGVSDPFDPLQNVLGGARYLRQQLDRFGQVQLALAAYNAGPNAVARHGGIPPFAETQAYVPRVLRYWHQTSRETTP